MFACIYSKAAKGVFIYLGELNNSADEHSLKNKEG